MNLIFDEQYGYITPGQRRAYRKSNIPPALHDELVDYFGDDHHAITVFALNNPSLNYGDVYRLGGK